MVYDDPQTTAEAKFSLEYNLAAGLLQGHIGISDFEPTAIARPEVRALFHKVNKEPVEKLESVFPTEVHIHTITGETFDTQIAMPVGSQQMPLTHAQMFTKFEDCVRGAAKWPVATELWEKLTTPDRSSPLSETTRLLRSAK